MNNTKFNVTALAEKTSDAYSADRYTSWKAVVQALATLGYDERQAEAILRSKWTRWARDAWDKPGTPTSTALVSWLLKNDYHPAHPDVISLTRESFEE